MPYGLLDKKDADEIVGGPAYPSCISCCEDKVECLWRSGAIEARMRHVSYSRCERCQLQDFDCAFVWGLMDPLRKIEDGLGRLVRHAQSENREAGRRAAENQVARDGILAVAHRAGK